MIHQNEDFYGSILKADLNIKFRDILKEEYGFDSIKYTNALEDTLSGESPASYILFEPQQFKNFYAKSFDPYDARESYDLGGLVTGVLDKIKNKLKEDPEKTKKWIDKAGNLVGVNAEDRQANERDTAVYINMMADKGVLPQRAKIKINARGNPVFGQGEDEEIFNAFNHALLSYRYGNVFRRPLLQAKEAIQAAYVENPDSEWTDAFNNHMGYGLRRTAKDETDALDKMSVSFWRTNQKLARGEPLVKGEDLMFNTEDYREWRNQQ